MMQNQRCTCNPHFRCTKQANSQLNCDFGHQTTSRRIGMDFPQQYIMYVSRLIALISISSRLFGVPTWHGMPDQLATRFRVARTEEGMLALPRSGPANIPPLPQGAALRVWPGEREHQKT